MLVPDAWFPGRVVSANNPPSLSWHARSASRRVDSRDSRKAMTVTTVSRAIGMNGKKDFTDLSVQDIDGRKPRFVVNMMLDDNIVIF